MTNVLQARVQGYILPKDAKNPAGQLSSEARFLECERIQVVSEQTGKVLGEWPTPLCPYTRKVLAARLERLAEAVGQKDPLVAQACVLGSNLVLHGTLMPPGAAVDKETGAMLVGQTGTLDQFRVLNQEDIVHGRSEETEGNEPPTDEPDAAG